MSEKITLVPLCTVGVVRDGESFNAQPGIAFAFTADEVKSLDALSATRGGKAMYRKPVDEVAAAEKAVDPEAARVKAESKLQLLVRDAVAAADKAATSKAKVADKAAAAAAADKVRAHAKATGLPVPAQFADEDL